MALMMLGIWMVASYLPARRASSVDPLESMRSEWPGRITVGVKRDSTGRVVDYPVARVSGNSKA